MSSIWDGIQSLLGGLITFFYEIIPNLGMAIILLTILIGIALFPLTLKQTRSMKAMQEIQPEIKRLQKELKHDRQAQQAAMMELYRERGVNPAAGCLPLLLQMPIWFALFSVLRSFATSNPTKWISEGSALEMAILDDPSFQSLDFLWMNLAISPNEAFSGVEDLGIAGGLGTAIPYFLTIAVVVFTAYWQQKQTMAKQQKQPGAPEQKVPGQAVLKIMPFFFGFISFNLPAGLVVYFAASQIFRIGQQALILGLDDRRAESEPPKTRPEKPKPAPEPSPEPDATSQPARPAQRRPQGSKKKRGKKRRRR